MGGWGCGAPGARGLQLRALLICVHPLWPAQYDMDSLEDRVQASKAEIRETLRRLNAFELNGMAAAAAPAFAAEARFASRTSCHGLILAFFFPRLLAAGGRRLHPAGVASH